MTKNRQASKSKSRSGNPAVRAAAATAAPHGGGVHQIFGTVRPALAGWLGDEQYTPEDVADLLDTLEMFFTRYAATFGVAPNLTNPAADNVAALLEDAADYDAELGVALAANMHEYLHFLLDTSRWTGTEAEQARLHHVVQPKTSESLPDIVVPHLSDVLAGKQAVNLPLWQLTRALLEWVGTGKEVTGTGVLRRKDIQGAAAVLGINAVGTDNRYNALVPNNLPEDTHWVQSMKEVPRLANYWQALSTVGFLKTNTTRARVTPLGERLLAGDLDPVGAVRSMAFLLYTGYLIQESNMYGDSLFDDIRLAALATAGSDSPLSHSAVFSTTVDGPFGLHERLRSEITLWAHDGLVVLGEFIVVPDVLRDPLDRAIKLATGEDPLPEDAQPSPITIKNAAPRRE